MGQDSYLPLEKSGQSVIDQNLPYRFLRGQPLKVWFGIHPNQTVHWSNQCSGVIRCSKTPLGTGRNNKQRPLSSQFSWCDTRNDLDYTRSCRLLYVSEPLDYVFERCSIVFLESGVLEAFTFRETALRSAWDLLAGNTHL